MRIYIDESGNFILGSQTSRVCCVIALVIPESVAPALLSEFDALRSTWTNEPELKGSSLTDDQTTRVLTLIGKFDVLVEIVAIDVSLQATERARRFQEAEAEYLVNTMISTPGQMETKFVHVLRDEWLRLPPQLFVQLYMLVMVIAAVIRTVPTYYAQRLPLELGKFDWVIDPKDVKPTRFEQIWEMVVGPLLQTLSFDQPLPLVTELDYSSFARFEMPIPEHLRPHLPTTLPKPETVRRDKGVNVRMLMSESVSFPNSKDESGLQLADIVGAAFTKAMNGKLAPPVWKLLGPLIVEKPRGKTAARLIALGDALRTEIGDHHKYVLDEITRLAKKMFVPR